MEENTSGGKVRIESKNLLIEYGDVVDKAIRQAVREALLKHKRAENPVAVWRDGKVVLLQPEEILPAS